MSEVEKSALKAGGDAPAVEILKSECIDKSLQSSPVEKKGANAVPENAAASAEVATSMLNDHVITEHSLKINSVDSLINEADNSIKHTATTFKATSETIGATEQPEENVIGVQVDVQLPSVTEVENPSVLSLHEQHQAISELVPEEKDDKLKQNAVQTTKSNNAASISKLETEVRKRTKERDDYRKKLEDTEKKLATLQAAYNATTNHGNDKNTLQESVKRLQGQLAQTALMYDDRNRVVANQENQINALNNQVVSLKEVVSITRDLLQIRNMEVKQLQIEVDNMEKKITEERDRHNAMISKMDTAMKLNADLKKEYETQLSLFNSLREKYGEKINLLSEEKRALEAATSSSE